MTIKFILSNLSGWFLNLSSIILASDSLLQNVFAANLVGCHLRILLTNNLGKLSHKVGELLLLSGFHPLTMNQGTRPQTLPPAETSVKTLYPV